MDVPVRFNDIILHNTVTKENVIFYSFLLMQIFLSPTYTHLII